jgi:hypothetical protein
MTIKRTKPEEIVVKLWQVEVLMGVLSDECELASARTVRLRFTPHRDRATRQERRRG